MHRNTLHQGEGPSLLPLVPQLVLVLLVQEQVLVAPVESRIQDRPKDRPHLQEVEAPAGVELEPVQWHLVQVVVAEELVLD